MPDVDMEPSRRLAYAFVEPAHADPGLYIRLPLEQRGGDPPIRLAPSSYGSMMVVFGHPYFREAAIRRGPIHFDGHVLSLERHEEADFRVHIPYDHLVEMAATTFPPEHWNEEGIRQAFHVYGQVCCIARSTLRTVDNRRDSGIADYSVLRVLVLVSNMSKVKPKLVVRNPRGEVAGIASIRIVGHWPHAPGAQPPDTHVFSDESSDDSSGGADGQSPPPRHASSVTSNVAPDAASASRPVQGEGQSRGINCRVLGALLYPSAPLWTFVSGATMALSRALSLRGVPRVIIRDLPPPERPCTPPQPPTHRVVLSDSDDITETRSQPRSMLPSLSDLLEEEEHEVSLRRRRARRKRATDSASKKRRSRRLAAKEEPFYTDATTKATRVKAAQLDLAKASERMKTALQSSGLLQRPPPAKILPSKLRRLGRVCGLSHLSEVEDDDDTPAAADVSP